jgi:hypothetical protein
MAHELKVVEDSIATSIGKVSFTVKAVEGKLSNAKIIMKEIPPFLPEGMEVESSISVLLKVKSSVAVKELEFTCAWNQFEGKGDGCSGEGLDAWEWEADNHLVIIGTEDGEWLASRLDLGVISRENYPVSMEKNRIKIEIAEYAQNKELTLHFVVAQNTLPEKVDCSCWYAVDVSHNRIIEACK